MIPRMPHLGFRAGGSVAANTSMDRQTKARFTILLVRPTSRPHPYIDGFAESKTCKLPTDGRSLDTLRDDKKAKDVRRE